MILDLARLPVLGYADKVTKFRWHLPGHTPPGGHSRSGSAGYWGERVNEDLQKIIDERERRARDLAWPPVRVGSSVRVRDCQTGVVHEYEVGNDVSIHSPLGEALIGRRAGQTATVRAPGGEWQVEVLDVSNEPSTP
jgi:hypothetical protein